MIQTMQILQQSRHLRAIRSHGKHFPSQTSGVKHLHSHSTAISKSFNFNVNTMTTRRNHRTTGTTGALYTNQKSSMMNALKHQQQNINKLQGGMKRFKSTATSQSRNKSTAYSEQSIVNGNVNSNVNVIQSPSSFSRMKEALHVHLLQPRTIAIPRWITPRQFSFNLSEIFGHASFVLISLSYATDDFLYLRIIAVAGSASMLVFSYFHPHGRVLWLPFKWNLLFIAINTYRIGRTFYYKHMELSEEMKKIKHDYFDEMDDVDFAKLISIATEESFGEGDSVCLQVRGIVVCQ